MDLDFFFFFFAMSDKKMLLTLSIEGEEYKFCVEPPKNFFSFFKHNLRLVVNGRFFHLIAWYFDTSMEVESLPA